MLKMTEKDFLKEKDKLLNAIDKNTKEYWKEYYKDVPIDCIYNDLVIDINEIKRLTDNWNGLEEYIKKEIYNYDNDITIKFSNRPNTLKEILCKMKEIKEGKNE